MATRMITCSMTSRHVFFFGTDYTLCSEKKTPTHIFFHISMNYLWI